MGGTWWMLPRLVQHIWDTGEIPQKMLLIIIILMVIWKVIKCIIYVRLKCVLLHDALHGFRTGRSCSTGTMEVKMTQQLASLEQCPFFGIFLSLKKAYNAMTWG